jgi:hypothetical protein
LGSGLGVERGKHGEPVRTQGSETPLDVWLILSGLSADD